MMGKLRLVVLFMLPLFFFHNSISQIGYSPVVDSLVEQINYDSLILFHRQVTGDTSVMICGTLDTIRTRHANLPGNARAAQFVKEKFESFGYTARFQNYSVTGQNVIATRTGTVYPDRILILCAHYDDRPEAEYAPGADDNGSGLSAMLETARIATGLDFPYTIQFIAFDEEEVGFLGSAAYVDSAFYSGQNIIGAINLDMIAWDSNNDNVVSIAANDASVPLLSDFLQCLGLYKPEISAYMMFSFGSSDHYRFWGRQYKSIMIHEDRKDFNPYYHTENDHFNHINKNYFYNLSQATAATFLSMALDFRMSPAHVQLTHIASSQPRTATLQLDAQHPADTTIFPPRLYYSLNGQPFDYIEAGSIIQGTCEFQLPAFSYGSVVSYYFAIQDSSGRFVSTLPAGGKGINPSGTVPPSSLYSYSVLKNSSQSYSASGLPVTFPGNDTAFVSIPILDAGRVLDVNTGISITHTNTWDLDLFLVSPSGLTVELSSCNGFIYDHYSSSVFDDEALVSIREKKAPFTGTCKPEGSLAILDNSTLQGEWKLMVINHGGTSGKVTAFSLSAAYSSGDLYVNGNLTEPGNGLSPETAFNTISQACQLNPSAGTTVFILPGEYDESVNFTSNGQEIVPLTTGIIVEFPNIIQFPAGTDLSGIDFQSHPGEYYTYLYRSRIKNSGFFQVVSADDQADQLIVKDASFLPGEGVAGDTNYLSCSVGRPVMYKKYVMQPGETDVVVDAGSIDTSWAILYIGDPFGSGYDDAEPANYNVIDGLEITGITDGHGIQVQNSSSNVIMNCRIHDCSGSGIYLNGDGEHSAHHNLIMNNLIFDTPSNGICVGAEGQSMFNNHTHYNHIIGNNFFTETPATQNASAILICGYNRGSVLRDNQIHDYNICGDSASAIEIHEMADHTLVTANSIRNVISSGTGLFSLIRVKGENDKVDIFNNILSDSLGVQTGMFAFRLDGSETDSCRVVHNTIYNVTNAFYLEDYSLIPDFDIQNNIIEVPGTFYTHSGFSGRFHVANNLYPVDPTPDTNMAYAQEEGRMIGSVTFRNASLGDFHLVVPAEPAICNGSPLFPAVSVDPERTVRCTEAPDIGAYELEDKKVWFGTSSNNWNDPSNWNGSSLPGESSNVVVEPAVYDPLLPAGTIRVNGLLVKEGATVHLPDGSNLVISQD
jgi:subtilisin-like proprotein convertase family protein